MRINIKFQNQLNETMKTNQLKGLFGLLLLFCFVMELHAQSNSGYRVIRSNLGNAGSSQIVDTSQGSYSVSQSIGQSSVIGTYHKNGYYLRQGYQQPTSKIKVVELKDFTLNANVFPNPFSQFVTIKFSDYITNDISVRVFDVNSKQIYYQIFPPSQSINLNIIDISNGIYFLKVISDIKQFNTKLIKI